jgi:hypothetical protein
LDTAPQQTGKYFFFFLKAPEADQQRNLILLNPTMVVLTPFSAPGSRRSRPWGVLGGVAPQKILFFFYQKTI